MLEETLLKTTATILSDYGERYGCHVIERETSHIDNAQVEQNGIRRQNQRQNKNYTPRSLRLVSTTFMLCTFYLEDRCHPPLLHRDQRFRFHLEFGSLLFLCLSLLFSLLRLRLQVQLSCDFS